MEVRVAEHAGFCFGVKRAVETVYEQLETGKTIYTYGPIVHNEEVVRELGERGVRVLESREELEAVKAPDVLDAGRAGTVIIRAHGVTEEICELMEKSGLERIDATCPFVAHIHRLVQSEDAKGKHIVVVGNPSHPEVEGIVSRCSGGATVLEDVSAAEKFSAKGGEKLFVVAQTTYNYNKFQDIVEILEKKGYNVTVRNTVCNATEERQRAARALASMADVMIVIGGKNSSNTGKLYEICREECADTYYIQTQDDLHLELPKSVRLVGIAAGASTPNKLIEEVQNYVRINF